MEIKNYDFRSVEENIAQFWDKHSVYPTIKQKNQGKKKFYYLDGPPYTSGKIHIGHAWGKALRDAAMRYKRAKGYDVWDRPGFDMHGLPISHKVEARLGIKGKDAIEKYGVDKFIEECKNLAVENMNAMIVDFKRLGIWMDFDNPYKPIDNSYIEGIWWLIKKAHENKRLYEGFRTLTWCPNCETATAKHELEYEKLKDNAIFVKFKIKNRENEYLIIWTTTPWTIPFNLAIMANPDVDYVRANVDNEKWIVAKVLADSLIKNNLGKEYEIIDEIKGKELEGVSYEHFFSKFIDYPKAEKLHTVLLSSEYVDTSSGSGLVHCAPGCGPEDYEVGHQNGLSAFNKLNEQGIFVDMDRLSGLCAKADDKKFIEFIDKEGALVFKNSIEHDYPHCWRCHKPIVFRATKQWFFKVEDLKERMKELNKEIHWVPDWAGSRQFHSWLDNLRDNSITKQIHWGTPFPVWQCNKCDNYTVVGSAKELQKLAGAVPHDLHKPYIDKVKIKCSCGAVQHKNPDVLDVWVDAGCSSWLCLDYPNKTDLFEKLFPPDFILEGKDQIRGWFNLLFVASMVSMDRPSFKACYMHGFINDSQGRKMSKSLGNVISPYEVIEKYGVDTLRYYMVGAANPGLDMNYNFDDLKIKSKNIGILWNLHNYLIDSAKTYDINPAKLKGVVLDTEEKFMLSKLNSSIKELTAMMDNYNLDEVPWTVEELFLELSRTYVQLVRDKLAGGTEDEKNSVLYTIYNVMIETLKLFTPIAPYVSEQMYLNLKSSFDLEKDSISYYSWPKVNEELINKKLEKDFIIAKDCIQSILNAREKAALGVRWPIKSVTVVTADEHVSKAVKHLKELIMVQTNVKNIDIVDKFEAVENIIKPNYKAIGQEFGPLSPKIIAKISSQSAETILKHIDGSGYKLTLDNAEIIIKRDHLVVESKVSDDYTYSEFNLAQVFLDTLRTPELISEGYYREVSRRVQNMRKNAGLVKTDIISLYIQADDEMKSDLDKFSKELSDKVGAKSLTISTNMPDRAYDMHETEKIKDKQVKIWFSKA